MEFPARDGVILSGLILNEKADNVIIMTHFGYRANCFGYQIKYQLRLVFCARWESAGWNVLTFDTPRSAFNLFLPFSDDIFGSGITLPFKTGFDGGEKAQIVNLFSGKISEATLGKGDLELILDYKDTYGVPLLCIFEKKAVRGPL